MKVEGVFNITGHGLVVVGDHGLLSPLHNGDIVYIETPEGKKLEATAYINLHTPSPNGKLSLTLVGVTKEDIPVGSEILWGWF